jgi:hypothetical protein
MRRGWTVGVSLATVLGALTIGGCPVFNASAALGLQDWGRDLLSIPAAVIIGELIDEAQGTNTPIDRNQLYEDLYADLSEDLQAGQPIPGPAGPQGPAGPAGPAGADGAPGADGQNGADGAPGADGQDGADGADGADGQDGADGEDGEDLYAVALGCIRNVETDDGIIAEFDGYGFNATKVQGTSGIYAVALIGYEFPAGFQANDLTILISPQGIVSNEIVVSYDAGLQQWGFLIEFRDVWLNQTNTDFCFGVYDTSEDPFANP